jgi:uncharacterized protein (TIGR03435 family)
MMKPLFVLLLPCVLSAQTLAGTWQGTLTPAPNRDVRMVFAITRDGNTHQGVYYNLDAGRQLNLGAMTVQGTTVTIAIPGMGATYEGKFAADGNTITGTLRQGGNALPLSFERATAQTRWELPPPPAPPKPLPADTPLEFEVASIKPSPASRPAAPGFNVTATELRAPNISVAALITFTFALHRTQVVGLPDWAETQGYTIIAKLPQGGDPTDDQIRTMLKNLLKSRFGLSFHTEQRELSVYAIGIGKKGADGIKMTPSASDGLNMGGQGPGRVRFRGATMGNLATQLQLRVLDRPVIDQTGLKDRYDFTLDWRPDEFQLPFLAPAQRAAVIANNDALPDLFTAFQEQLGLKLEGTKAPATVLIIDKVSTPSEN